MLAVFYAQEPDPRLLDRPHTRFLRLPTRLKTAQLLREMLAGYDIIAYMDYSPASYLYLHLPKRLRKHTKIVLHVEGPAELGKESPMLKFLYMGIVPKCDFYTGITEHSAQDFNSVFHRTVCVFCRWALTAALFHPLGMSTNTSRPYCLWDIS